MNMNIMEIILLIYLSNLILTLVVYGANLHLFKRPGYLVAMLIFPIFGLILFLITTDNYLLMRAKKIVNDYPFDNLYFEGNYTLFESPAEFYYHLTNKIRSSKKRIYLSFYAINNDIAGRPLINAINQASLQTEVIIIYDPHISKGSKGLFKELKKRKNTKIIPFHYSKKKVKLHQNYRLHQKIAIIDDYGYIGSSNIEQNELGVKIEKWQDTTLGVEGDPVEILVKEFMLSAYFASKNKYYLSKIPIIDKLDSAPKDTIISSSYENPLNIKHHLLDLLYQAQKKVIIMSPFISLDDSLLDALKIISKRVQVELLIPQEKSKLLAHVVTRMYSNLLLNYNIKINVYKGFDHTKLFIIDDQTLLYGSANFDLLSLKMNFETDIIVTSDVIVEKFVNYYHKRLADSYPYKKDHKNKFIKFLVKFFSINW